MAATFPSRRTSVVPESGRAPVMSITVACVNTRGAARGGTGACAPSGSARAKEKTRRVIILDPMMATILELDTVRLRRTRFDALPLTWRAEFRVDDFPILVEDRRVANSYADPSDCLPEGGAPEFLRHRLRWKADHLEAI